MSDGNDKKDCNRGKISQSDEDAVHRQSEIKDGKRDLSAEAAGSLFYCKEEPASWDIIIEYNRRKKYVFFCICNKFFPYHSEHNRIRDVVKIKAGVHV